MSVKSRDRFLQLTNAWGEPAHSGITKPKQVQKRQSHVSKFHEIVDQATEHMNMSEQKVKQSEQKLLKLIELAEELACLNAQRAADDVAFPKASFLERFSEANRGKPRPRKQAKQKGPKLPKKMTVDGNPNYAALTASFLARHGQQEMEALSTGTSNVRLTKGNSAMIRMGLSFDLNMPDAEDGASIASGPASARGPESLALTALPDFEIGTSSLKRYLHERGWALNEGIMGDGDLSDDDSMEELGLELDPVKRGRAIKQKRRVIRQEYRESVQEHIDRREARRTAGREQRDVLTRMRQHGTRVAMWLTIVTLNSQSFMEAPRRQRTTMLLRRFFMPLWTRYWALKKRRMGRKWMVAQGRGKMEKLTPEVLRGTGPLFSKWDVDNLNSFINKMFPVVFRPGEYICHLGDSSYVLYILVGGSVDVIILPPNSQTKKRGKKSGLTVATLTPTKYFGEYGVFADEPRAATLYCATRVYCWACTKEVFCFQLQRLAPEVVADINKAFEAMVVKIYKVRPAQLASTNTFLNWNPSHLDGLVKEFEPVVFYENSIILKQGDAGSCMYLIARGRCEAIHSQDDAPNDEMLLGPDMQFGNRACIFLEGQYYTVRALSTVQAWRLKKEVLMYHMLDRPDWFLRARQRMNRELEKSMPKPYFHIFVASSGFLEGFPHSLVEQLYHDHFKPKVTETGLHVVYRGDPLVDFLYFVNGHATDAALPPRYFAGWDYVKKKRPRWEKTITATGRVETWLLPLGSILSVLEKTSSKVLDRKPELKTVLTRLQAHQELLQEITTGDAS